MQTVSVKQRLETFKNKHVGIEKEIYLSLLS